MKFVRPKRRRDKYNPYKLDYDENKNQYIIMFLDNNKQNHKVIVTKEIYETFNRFELEDLSIMNKFDNHIEHAEVYENNLVSRAVNKPESLEMIVERKINYELLYKNINKLPEIQKRRLQKYYFLGKTFEEIALEENCTKRAIKFSVDLALKKLRQNFIESKEIDYTNDV